MRTMIIAMAISTLLCGCVMTTQEGGKIKAQMAEMQKRLDEVEAGSKHSQQTVENNIDSMAENIIAFENLRQDVAMLKGEYEEEKFSKDRYVGDYRKLHSYLNGEFVKIDKRMRKLEEKTGIESPSGKPVVPTTLGAVPVANKSEKELYAEAVNSFKRKKYKLAKSQFDEFIKKFPGSHNAADAKFFIAECYFGRKMYTEAIVSYDKLTIDHPKNKKVPEAIYSQALSFEMLGQKFDAKLFFEKVIKEYPRSSVAAMAKKRLKLLKK
jgi:tol-pal system protein YbgF